MNKEITITVDCNDGDYNTSVLPISNKDLFMIRPLVESIKNFKPYHSLDYNWGHNHNYPDGGCLRDDLGELTPIDYYEFSREVHELFESFCPDCEYGFHTIVSVSVTPISEKEVLL